MNPTFSLWLTLSKEDEAYLFDRIKRLSEKYRAPIFSPHCTVLSPIRIEPETLKTVLLDKMEDWLPLRVKSLGLGHSDLLWKTVFIKLEKSQPLRAIRQFVESLQSPNPNPNPFHPHISLIYKKMDDVLRKEIVANSSLKNNYTFTGLSLIRTDRPIEEWKTIFKVELES